ncbi:hypothetical protein PG990_007211 [Apiospora arundinis]
MPYLRAEAPPHIPDHETIESLLGQKYTDHSKRVRKTKTFQQLTEEERARKNLVQLGTWTERIQGDPYGFWSSWAGNIAHPRDERMYDILGPIFDELNATPIAENADLTRLASFLSKVTTTDALTLAKEFSDDQKYKMIRDTLEELVVTFSVNNRMCRLMWAKDLDKNDDSSYSNSKRARLSAQKATRLFTEPIMSIKEQQYLMAKFSDTSTDSQERQTLKLLTTLRNMAREHFWLHMDAAQREAVREAVAKEEEIDPEFEPGLTVIRANWQKRWNNGKRDPDYYRNYLVDSLAAESVWEMVDEDIVLVLDKNRQLVFVHFEKLVQTLYGHPDPEPDANTDTDPKGKEEQKLKKVDIDIEDRLIRAIDLFSFFVGIPKPESPGDGGPSPQRQDVRRPLRLLGVQGDPYGRRIRRTADSRNARATARNDVSYELVDRFYPAVFGKASDVFRFLMRRLDPEYYAQCVEIFEQLPDNNVKIRTTRDDGVEEKDLCSLFALGINGHTQRHMDQGDIRGGLAGLLTVGNYTGGNLCLPQLNLKVPYQSGSCALIRGGGMEHLVTDFTGPRFFVVGTNHETARKYAMRKLGRLPPLPPRGQWDQRDAAAREAYPGSKSGPTTTTTIGSLVLIAARTTMTRMRWFGMTWSCMGPGRCDRRAVVRHQLHEEVFPS